MRLVRAAIVSVALALAFPSGAAALRLVPPGNSAANQYTETLPGPGGNEPTGGIPGKAGATPEKALGAANAARLAALGSEGRAAAQLAAEAAPPKAGAGGGAKGASPNAASGLGQVLAEISGTSHSGGMGPLLPLTIALTALAAAGFAFLRHRKNARGH